MMETFLLVVLFLLAIQWIFHKKLLNKALKFEKELKNELDDLEKEP